QGRRNRRLNPDRDRAVRHRTGAAASPGDWYRGSGGLVQPRLVLPPARPPPPRVAGGSIESARGTLIRQPQTPVNISWEVRQLDDPDPARPQFAASHVLPGPGARIEPFRAIHAI